MSIQINERAVAMAAVAGSTYGSEGTPSYTLAIPMFRQTAPMALEVEKTDRAPLAATLTKNGKTVGKKTARFTPGLVLQGHGGDTNPAHYRMDAIFKACGLELRSTTGGTFTYGLRSTGYESIAMLFAEIGEDDECVLWDLKGGIGTFEMSGSAGDIIQVNPNLQFLYTRPTRGPLPSTPDLGSLIDEILENCVATIVPQGGSDIDTELKSFNFKTGWTIGAWTDIRANAGVAKYKRQDRVPTLDMVVGMESDAYVDEWLDALEGGYSKRLHVHVKHGSGAGKYIDMDWYGQLMDLPQQSEVGSRTLAVSTELVSSSTGAGDSEFTLKLY